jgi:cytochrome P450
MKIPDGPKTPRWLQKIQWTMDSLSFMDAAVQRYGDIFNAPVIGNTATVLLVSNPQALQQIFSSDTKQFTAPANQLLQPLVGNHSMFVYEGDRHRRERKLVMPPFHGDRMRAYGQLIVDLTEKAFAQLVPNQSFTARTVMQDISMEVILKVVFGLSDGEQFRQLKQRITALTGCL